LKTPDAPTLISEPLPTTDTKTRSLIGLRSASLIVIANMIGAGVFGITGELAISTPSHPALLISWVIGGIMALCGALSYGELAARFPRSGGEYLFLSKLYHPSLGFTSGFVSLVVGFSASIAANASIFGIYLTTVFPELNATYLAIGLVSFLTLVHAFNVKYGVAFQDAFASLKIMLILVFISAGLFWFEVPVDAVPIRVLPDAADWSLILNGAYAVGLVSIFYAYLGWNASVYLTGEVRNSRRNVPLSLVIGSVTVTCLYLLLNYVFLRTVPLESLTGKVEIGALSATAIFGTPVGKILSGLIAFALVSSCSSMVMAGPRVTQSIGEDYKLFQIFSKRTSDGGPVYALLAQWIIAMVMLLTASFWDILSYIGFTLSIFASLAVFGVYVARIQAKHTVYTGYKTWGYPVTPAIFIALSLWMVVHSLTNNPTIAFWGCGTLVAGLGLYAATKYLDTD